MRRAFNTTDYFATFHLRAKDGVQVILHLGAKAREGSIAGGVVNDPSSLLEWHDKDRATLKFRDLAEIEAKRAALVQLVRQWIGHV